MIAQIVIGRKLCQIVDEKDAEFLKKLDRELSFFVPGAEYSKAYSGYLDSSGKTVTWDGRKHLLKSDLSFPPGLLDRVERFYKGHNKQYNLVDHRKLEEASRPHDIFSSLSNLNITPYDYQLEAVETASKQERGIVKLPTGSGKSAVIALLTAKLNKSACVFVIGKDLLYQLHKFFSLIFDEKIGIIGDGLCEIHDINIVSVWTANQALGLKNNKRVDEEEAEKKIVPEKYKHIKHMLANTKIHIFDECQIMHADSIQCILKNINPDRIFGFSGSPYHQDGSDLLIESYLGNKIVDIPAIELINKGYLVPPKIKFLSVPPYESTKKKQAYKKVYADYIVNNDVRNGMIIKGAQKLVEQGFQTLILFQSINHGQILYNELKKVLPCQMLSGTNSSTERERVKNDLENNKLQCVIASKIFDIGIDIKTLSALILAPSGKSEIRALQRIGRVIRKSPGKTMAAVLDFADCAPFLLSHSEARYKIYLEEGFDVTWPNKKQ